MLRLLALGHTNQEIAKQLYISVRTAETHRAHIMQKLRLATRAELVRYALADGLLEPPENDDGPPEAALVGATEESVYAWSGASLRLGSRLCRKASAVSGFRRAPPMARIAKPMPLSSRATPTTIPNSESCSAM